MVFLFAILTAQFAGISSIKDRIEAPDYTAKVEYRKKIGPFDIIRIALTLIFFLIWAYVTVRENRVEQIDKAFWFFVGWWFPKK